MDIRDVLHAINLQGGSGFTMNDVLQYQVIGTTQTAILGGGWETIQDIKLDLTYGTEWFIKWDADHDCLISTTVNYTSNPSVAYSQPPTMFPKKVPVVEPTQEEIDESIAVLERIIE